MKFLKRLVIIALLLIAIISCTKKRRGRQIIYANGREYYVDYYAVLLSSDCIEFTAYSEDNDSSFVKICSEWNVKPNKNNLEEND